MKYLRKYPTTIDIEILYFLANLWWLAVFMTPPGVFSGIAYDRAITTLGRDILVAILTSLSVISIVAFSRRELAYIALITGPIVFTYFSVVSILGDTIAFNAAITFIIAGVGIYRLFSYTYYRDR